MKKTVKKRDTERLEFLFENSLFLRKTPLSTQIGWITSYCIYEGSNVVARDISPRKAIDKAITILNKQEQ